MSDSLTDYLDGLEKLTLQFPKGLADPNVEDAVDAHINLIHRTLGPDGRGMIELLKGIGTSSSNDNDRLDVEEASFDRLVRDRLHRRPLCQFCHS